MTTYKEKILPYLTEEFYKWVYETAIQRNIEGPIHSTRNGISFIREECKGRTPIVKDYSSPTRKDLEDLILALPYKFREGDKVHTHVYTYGCNCDVDDRAPYGQGFKPLFKVMDEVVKSDSLESNKERPHIKPIYQALYDSVTKTS